MWPAVAGAPNRQSYRRATNSLMKSRRRMRLPGQERYASSQNRLLDFCDGVISGHCVRPHHLCFALDSGLKADMAGCQFSANNSSAIRSPRLRWRRFHKPNQKHRKAPSNGT
jgi:hypothetical protein